MNRIRMFAMCLLAMMATSLSLKAQEITITLSPNWNWISYPNAVPMELNEALGDFVPAEGDMIKSQYGFSSYHNGYWLGSLTHFMPGKGYVYYSSRSELTSFVFAQPSSSFVATAMPTDITTVSAVVGGMVTIGEGNHLFARGVCWGTEPNPDIDGSHTTDATIVGSLSDTLTELSPGTTYYVRAYMVTDFGLAYGENLSFTTEHEYVDLGLPSGLLWATCNVGADTPYGYGDYFAWGETQPKSTYNWNTYQYCNGSSSTLTKYCNKSSFGYNGYTDDLTTLLPEDDAATANWGSGWRMPTEEEWQELDDYCTLVWTNQNGVRLTGPNGNSLYLPAAGYRYGSSLHYAGTAGLYWSSSLCMYYPDGAEDFMFSSSNYGEFEYNRYCGRSVRPVRSSGQSTSFIINATSNPAEGGEVSGGGSYQEGTECTLTATANVSYTFTNWTENDEVVSTDATYTFTVNADRNLVANFTYNGGGNHEYVDLGLPSGLLWATCNVGADNPEDYGDYFAWGETQPKDIYNLSTYQYANGTSWQEPQLTKYCNNSSYGYNGFTDNLTTLLPEDDAATANWGSNWRMPTKEEWQELYNNTTCTWTTQNGVNGRLFAASNGNSLFLPAAGYRYGSSLYYAGSIGDSWSSSLNTGYSDDAWRLEFSSDDYYMGNGSRYYGLSVRPVRSASQNTSFIINATSNPAEGGEVSGGGSYQEGTECTLTATPNEGYTFANWTENDELVSTDATYTFTVSADRNLVANFTYNGGGNHEYVDLGLPSGLLWATCNVGADNPEDYGDYFAWGETQPKDTYNWSTYQYANGTSWQEPQLTKYCNNSIYGYNGFTDNLTTLLPEDDAATANWGSNWRMPTKEEWQELYNNTTCTWTTQNGVNGRLFAASNGNSLFLPAAGYRNYSSLYYAGSNGDSWSSSLNTGYSGDAWYFNFSSDDYDMYSGGYRYFGRSVRPVRSASQNTLFIIDATANPAEGGEVNGGGTYQEGTECTLTATPNEGYTFANWTENDEVVSTDATYTFIVSADRTLVANFTYNGVNAPTGAINGLFSVSEGHQVYFSQGNLQYQASTNTWRFAENQYDYVGSTNSNISSTYSGWIDLFGWGTSGYNHGANCYQPWSTSTSYSDYYAYGNDQYNLYDQTGQADWGYNAISNGGNQTNQWRTLTQPEWDYVFNTRTTTSGIRYAKAQVNNVNGVILLPDDWSTSTYSLSNTNSSGASFSSNTLTALEWSTLEQAGAVFLPAAGNRPGTSVYNVGSGGYYWSASYDYSDLALGVYFYDSYLYTNNYSFRYNGQSVRLVRVAEN